MKQIRKRVLLSILCGASAIIALFWPMLPMADDDDRLATISMDGPGFESLPLPLSDADKSFLAGANAIQRIVQTRHGSLIILSVIDGSGNRHAVHDPAYCLAGGGWSIRSQDEVALSSGIANRILMEKNGKMMEAMWFFDDGKVQFTSPIEYWWRASLRRATRGHSGSEPVLVMLRVPPGGKTDWKHVRQVILPALGFR